MCSFNDGLRLSERGFTVCVELLVAGQEAHAAVERIEQNAVARVPDVELRIARMQQKPLRLGRAQAEPEAQAEYGVPPGRRLPERIW